METNFSDAAKAFWAAHKKKIIVAVLILVAVVAIYAYGCSVGMGCR